MLIELEYFATFKTVQSDIKVAIMKMRIKNQRYGWSRVLLRQRQN